MGYLYFNDLVELLHRRRMITENKSLFYKAYKQVPVYNKEEYIGDKILAYADQHPHGRSEEATLVREGKYKRYHIGWLWLETGSYPRLWLAVYRIWKGSQSLYPGYAKMNQDNKIESIWLNSEMPTHEK